MDTILLSIVRWFIERQLLKYGEAIDWEKVKADCQARIKQLLPDSVFDATAEYIVGVFLDIVSAYFVQNKVPLAPAGISNAITYAQSMISRELAARALKK